MIFEFIFYSILAGLIGGGIWILFFGFLGTSFHIIPKTLQKRIFETIEKIDLYLKNTLKIPSAILMIFYYLGLIWLFTRFIHLLIIIAEYLGFS